MIEHTPAPSQPTNSEPTGPEVSGSALLEQPGPEAVGALPTARRGWPWWAWVLLLGVLLQALSGLGAVLIANMLVGQATQALICYADGYCGAGSKTESTPDATEAPVERKEPTDRVTLNGHAVFDGRPEWAIQPEPTWQALTFDQDGVNMFREEATECQLITTQGLALPDAQATDDSSVSDALLEQQIAGFTGDDPDAKILESSVTDISIAVVGSGSTIEFVTATLTRTTSEGVLETVELAARSMPDSGSELVAALICDADVYETFDSNYAVFSKLLAVTAKR